MTTLILNKIAADETEMTALGEALAGVCPKKAVIYLQGELGAGKTTLVRGFLRAKGHVGSVKSPTYTLVEPYDIEGESIYHFDFYRIKDPMELEFMGIKDYFGPQSICLIEWAEYAKENIPHADVICRIDFKDDGRLITLTGLSDIGKQMIEKLQ